MNNSWKKGDLVLCIGGRVGKDKPKPVPAFSVCKIIEVGQFDLLLQEYPARSFSRTEIAPIKSCIKIPIGDEEVFSAPPTSPRLGDLVYSFSSVKYGKEDSFSGILYSIEYSFGKPKACQILCGDEIKNSHYENLLDLQRNSEQ